MLIHLEKKAKLRGSRFICKLCVVAVLGWHILHFSFLEEQVIIFSSDSLVFSDDFLIHVKLLFSKKLLGLK